MRFWIRLQPDNCNLIVLCSAWAGSLKKTNKNRPVQGLQKIKTILFFKSKSQSVATEVEDENPWAGSLRHVDDHRKGKAKKEEKEDTYGNAPWMGTLRFASPFTGKHCFK